MVNAVFFAGSFAAVWLSSWLVCALILAISYPLVRKSLFKWHPAPASALLLAAFSFPLILSLFATTLLFIPEIETNLVAQHCHDDCLAHAPELNSIWLAWASLILIALLLGFLFTRVMQDLKTANNLHRHLSITSNYINGIYVLDDTRPLAFALGWWRNKTYLTQGFIDKCQNKDLDIVLAHENAHSSRRDNLRLLIARIALLILPTPLATRYYDDLHTLSESACDFAAANRFGSTEVADTLLKLQRLITNWPEQTSSIVYSAFNESAVEIRIKNLLSNDSSSKTQERYFKLFIVFLLSLSVVLLDPLHRGIEILIGG
jgi:beta-lactamase regulating signal transducer with metallopeptidase domain